jgi:hypothetical protein
MQARAGLHVARAVRVGWVGLVVCMSAAALAPTAWSGYSPVRLVYDYSKTDSKNNCNDPESVAADHGRCGAVDGPVFNSFINTPSFGDERYFFDGRLSGPQTSHFADPVWLTSLHGQEVVLRIYIDNDANEVAGFRTTASGTRVRVALPATDSDGLRAVAWVSADNASPAEVADSIDLTARHRFRVRYVTGSAVLLRGTREYPLPDQIVAGGTQIGDTVMNGVFPAGFGKAALVELRVKVFPAHERGSGSFGRLIAGIAGGALLAGLAAIRRSRSGAWKSLHWMWGLMRDREVWQQVLATAIVAGSTALILLLTRR